MKTLSFGEWPSFEEFQEHYAKESLKNSLYEIRHGSKTGPFDPPSGDYSCDALWSELHRLEKLAEGQSDLKNYDHAMSWVSDILGTLGFEWI